MGSRGGKASTSSSLLQQPVWACLLALCLLLSCCCSPCQGRKLPADGEATGGKVMHFEGGLVLRVPPGIASNANGSGGESSSAVAPELKGNKGFSAAPGSGRAARLMRSVPSPGVGH